MLYGVGINDLGIKSASFVYKSWSRMLARCYASSVRDARPSYDECITSEEWKSISSFKTWFDTQKKDPDYHLDKDVLFPGNTVYSAETCIFIPNWLNTFITDRKSKRGLYPIGVNHLRGKFQANCGYGGWSGERFQKYLGVFSTPEGAHEAWRQCKIEQIHIMKDVLDSIDNRLYPALIDRYENNKY